MATLRLEPRQAMADHGASIRIMRDLQSPTMICLKGGLFLLLGFASAALLIADTPTLRLVLLLALCVWSFCRAYYFAFYVIEHYVDPSYRFSGLLSFVQYVLKKRRGR